MLKRIVLARPKTYLTEEQALDKMQHYCAYQDRCHQEVRTKLLELQVYGDRLERVMYALIQDNFLNEERFARSYARGKFNIKKWGRVRIERELKKRHVSDYCIRAAMSEIDEADYLLSLQSILEKKDRLLTEPNAFKRRAKLAAYAMGRGYESGLVWELVKKLID